PLRLFRIDVVEDVHEVGRWAEDRVAVLALAVVDAAEQGLERRKAAGELLLCSRDLIVALKFPFRETLHRWRDAELLGASEDVDDRRRLLLGLPVDLLCLAGGADVRSDELDEMLVGQAHDIVCRLLLEKKKSGRY